MLNQRMTHWKKEEKKQTITERLKSMAKHFQIITKTHKEHKQLHQTEKLMAETVSKGQ